MGNPDRLTDPPGDTDGSGDGLLDGSRRAAPAVAVTLRLAAVGKWVRSGG